MGAWHIARLEPQAAGREIADPFSYQIVHAYSLVYANDFQLKYDRNSDAVCDENGDFVFEE
ncbi:MAG: hypothetical protein NVSMB64_22950 [Candidatus Velthaea sp.]